MTNEIERKLADMGYTLPHFPTDPNAITDFCVRNGNLLFVGGCEALDLKTLTSIIGKIDADYSVEQAREFIKSAVIGELALIKDHLGSLDRVDRIVKMIGYVNVSPGFKRAHEVINGASKFLVDIFGPERGRHTRTTLGVADLALGCACEIDLIVAIKD